MSTWLFDLGNTRLKFASRLADGRVGEVQAVAHDDADGWLSALPSGEVAAVASVALPRLALPGRVRSRGRTPPSRVCIPSGVIDQWGVGRRNSLPSGRRLTAYQSPGWSGVEGSRTMLPPVRGQLVESPTNPAPAETHTTFGDSQAAEVTWTSSQLAMTVMSGRELMQSRSTRSILLISPTRSSWSRERLSRTRTEASSLSAIAGTWSSSTSSATTSARRPARRAEMTPASMLSPPSLVATV